MQLPSIEFAVSSRISAQFAGTEVTSVRQFAQFAQTLRTLKPLVHIALVYIVRSSHSLSVYTIYSVNIPISGVVYQTPANWGR